MVLAELEFFHSRPIAPTRRVALGDSELPVDPAPGFGGILLGGVAAANARQIDPDLLPELNRLVNDLDEGRRIAQPRLRHRFQRDRVGLLRSRQRLVGRDGTVAFDFDEERSTAVQRLLAAVYAAGALSPLERTPVLAAIRTGIRWEGAVGPTLVAALSGVAGGHTLPAGAFEDPVGWALGVLGLTRGSNGVAVDPQLVQRRFRTLLRLAHPDHGGATDDAAERIADLREARRILLA